MMSDNKRTPQIRFKGFTDDWEQRKLNEISSINKGKQLNKLDMVDSGKYYVLNGGITPSGYTNEYNTYENIISISEGGNSCGYVNLNRCKFWSGGHNYTLQDVKINTDFLYQYLKFNEDFIMSLRVGSGLPNIQKARLEELSINYPKEEEQVSVGCILGSIDNLITLHQRKYDKLVNMKKSMLEKMFPKNSKKVPEIRFKGFTDEWEQRKLGDVIEDYVEKTTIQNQYPVLTSSQQYGIVLQEDYFANRQITTDNNVGYFVLPKGYFTYRSRSDSNLFVFNRNNLINKGIISYYYPVFSSGKYNSNFLLRRLNYGIEDQLTMAAEGTGQRVLNHSSFKKMETRFPSNNEQIKIGLLFEKVDNLITLHQRKLEKLNSLKKSMLEKMFV